MAYWDCPRCAAENSLDATCCWRCGFQNYGGVQDTAPPRERPEQSTDVLRKQRQSVKEEMKKSLDDGLERSRATLDRLAGGRPASGK
jgi:Zn ribbon nucleic-acid-binding protein